MADWIGTDLEVNVRKTVDGQYYEYCVVDRGVVVVIAANKTGGIDDDIARAADAATTAAATPAA